MSAAWSDTQRSDAFRYRASTDAGAMIEGVVRAPSREAALRTLRGQQLWPVEVTAASPVRVVAASRIPFAGAAARRRAVAQWTRTVATLLDAGAPMERALGVAEAQAADTPMRDPALAIRRAVQGGASLADSMQLQTAVFSGLHSGVVRAGEASGALSASLDTLAGYLEEDEALRAQLAGALLYPAMMAVVASVGVLILLLFVVPRFSTLLADLGGTLPLSTRILVALGSAVTHGWWIAALLVGAGIIVTRVSLASPASTLAWHARRLQIPFTGAIERGMVTARFTRALGLMLKGGMPLLPALRLATTGVANRALAASLEQSTQKVMRGDRLADSLAGTLTPMALQLLAVGEESGRLGDLALRAAVGQESDVRRSLRTVAALLEPGLIIVFGAIVGFVALAMLQAIYAVNAGM